MSLREKVERYFRRRDVEKIELDSVEMKLFGAGKAVWKADRVQQNAAWEMYVELVTRIALQPLAEDSGLLREALSSLYDVFGETRRILRDGGTKVATPLNGKVLSFGEAAIGILNNVLRPFLTKWHPLLEAYEITRSDEVSRSEHEKNWARHDELRHELEEVQEQLRSYADVLARVCGISPIHRGGD